MSGDGCECVVVGGVSGDGCECVVVGVLVVMVVSVWWGNGNGAFQKLCFSCKYLIFVE